jgi:hypothetical protein
MCLIFLIAAHNGTSQPGEAWRRARTGIGVLCRQVCVGDCAGRCLVVLRVVVGQLSYTVDFDFDRIVKEEREAGRVICGGGEGHENGRVGEAVDVGQRQRQQEQQRAWMGQRQAQGGVSRGANDGTFADPFGGNADNVLAHAEDLPLGFGFTDLLNMDVDTFQ